MRPDGWKREVEEQGRFLTSAKNMCIERKIMKRGCTVCRIQKIVLLVTPVAVKCIAASNVQLK